MANSDITKRAIADAFRQLLEEKPFDRITVTSIAATCGVNRQTFYYHFRDIYDLMAWMVEDGVSTLFLHLKDDRWQRRMAAVLEVLGNDRTIVLRLMRSIDPTFAYHLFRDKVVGLVLKELDDGRSGLPLSAENRMLLADFYAGGFTEVTLRWIDDGMRESPEHLVDRLDRTLRNSL